MTYWRYAGWIALAVDMTLQAACAHEEAHEVTVQTEQAAIIVEQDIEYQPEELIVRAGQRIRIENRDPFEHKSRVTLLKADGSLGAMAVAGHVDKPGKSFAFTLDKPGAYEIRCLLHDGMTAVIRVVGRSAGRMH